jgi:hypothetical protein
MPIFLLRSGGYLSSGVWVNFWVCSVRFVVSQFLVFLFWAVLVVSFLELGF